MPAGASHRTEARFYSAKDLTVISQNTTQIRVIREKDAVHIENLKKIKTYQGKSLPYLPSKEHTSLSYQSAPPNNGTIESIAAISSV